MAGFGSASNSLLALAVLSLGSAACSGSPLVKSDAGAARHPFPQNLESEYCVFPSEFDNDDARAAYQLWKETVVTAEGAQGFLRVKKPDSGAEIGSTVSEGVGYGMLLAVYMDDQELFDALWQYAMYYMNANGLMQWQVNPAGVVIGFGAALDGDEDMAWALLMADRQWGSSEALEKQYLEYAVDLIEAIWEHEIDHELDGMPLPGDAWSGRGIANISYFAPAYYRLFGEVTENEQGWEQVVETSYTILEKSLDAEYGNEANGLVPAWCDVDGAPIEAFDGAATHYQNDSTRTPFRIGQDYCYNGEPRAREYMAKVTDFFANVGIENIVDGYDLDGTPHPDHAMGGELPASFVGPAGVAASHSEDHQRFVDEAYEALATLELNAGTIYYQKSWTALSLLMMTGNFATLPR